MYIPIAFYKNSLVLIDNMDTFALYFCSSVKQKMRQSPGESAAGYDGDGIPSEHDSDEEVGGGVGFTSDDSLAGSFDDDDDI